MFIAESINSIRVTQIRCIPLIDEYISFSADLNSIDMTTYVQKI